jgi:zinc-ribbon domain
MAIFVGLIVLAAVLVVLAYPLYLSRPRAVASSSGAVNDLLAQRDGLYATLRDLDLDFELGKLDGTDYHSRREKYLGRASLVLQQLDRARAATGQDGGMSDEIEREVAALRRAQGMATGPSTHTCPNCGRVYNEGDRFCGRCGHTLP